ncbi:metalloregulator ArsR/SmtB family transcription factor [Patescibacteria group bacterium]|nr:metalloregulator ArsR/SmtB family transcription factor [Patescibacteria group bacterium]MBU1970699.1 metalloregulator ArsR/SmtB family transcription factor [Patescibacteria group bacterium]
MMNFVKISKAMSDKNRLKILEMLSHKEEKVGVVSEKLGVEENLASHHLRVLSGLGFLKSDKRGREVYYRLNHAKIVSLLVDLQKNKTFKELLAQAVVEAK